MPGQTFREPGFRSHRRWLTEDELALMRDNAVLAAVDVLVICQGRIYLGKRTRQPAQGFWWTLGGIMNPGESYEETAVRVMKREWGIQVAPERFKLLGPYNRIWAKRNEPPQDHGTHTSDTVMILEVTTEEIATIPPEEEFSSGVWIPPQLVIERESEFYPAIVQVCKDYLAARSAP